MSVPGANFQCFGDIFPYLTDELVESETACVENIIDSLYNYGLIHGDSIQSKLEKSPFYTKDYKKITPKQQQLLRAERVKREEAEEESDSSEDEPVKIKQPTKKGKAKAPPKETISPPTLLNSGRTFIGVSFVSAGRSRGDEKGGRGKAVDLSGSSNQNTFEASITVSNRRILVGAHPTVEIAAQAHDRALIRANGPMSYKQAGLLNYPLSFYASDSLSKFSAFDTLLRKQLFGSDWTGPKPVDFGFLMTQHSKLPAKRGADFNAMDGSGRKKRHKGQYRGGDDSNSDCDFEMMSSPYTDSGKKKKLLYGNYYVSTGASREDAETAEPYFKSPVPVKRQPSFTNKKVPKAVPADQSSLPLPGDTVVLMHGIKERNLGRPAYERGVILKKMPSGGWLQFGFADHTTKHLRGEVVTLMGPCETNLKFMKVPPEAITDEDRALVDYFEQQGMLEMWRPPRGAPTSLPKGSAASSQGEYLANTSTSSVTSEHHVSANVPAAPVKRFAAKDLQLASAWYQGSSQRVNTSATAEEQDAYEPESLYNLADYPCLGTAAYKELESNSDTGSFASLELSGDPTKRGSRSTGAGPSALGSRPPNFQTFTSSMFAHKLNDLMASACYLLPQELLLYRVLLGLAEKHVPEKQTGAKDAPNKDSGENADSEQAGGSASDASTSTTPGGFPSDHPVFPSSPPPSLPVLPWHRSLLQPSSVEMRTALSLTRQQLHEVLVAALSAGVDLLALIERTPQHFHGVQVVNHLPKPSAANSTESVEPKAVTRYTFEVSTESKKLVLDLGISAGIINAGTIIANGALGSSLGAAQQAPVESGKIIVGYFSSALEAALVREQVLGLTRSSFGIASSYGGFAGERSSVPEKANFTPAEWAELKKIAKFLTRFTRKYSLG